MTHSELAEEVELKTLCGLWGMRIYTFCTSPIIWSIVQTVLTTEVAINLQRARRHHTIIRAHYTQTKKEYREGGGGGGRDYLKFKK